MKLVECKSPAGRSALPHAASLRPFDAGQLQSHAADLHLCALSANDEVLAHCSLWWKLTPQLPGHSIGAIGHFAACDEHATTALLDRALERLRDNRCTLAVGPMDGNTWRRYRFVTAPEPNQQPEPPFFLEPSNLPEWPQYFERAGFSAFAEYYSGLNSDLSRVDPRLQAASSRLENAGVRIRSAVDTDLTSQLKRIYQVSRISFTRNFLYTELPEDEFLAQYTPLLPRIQPQLILLAERDGALVGYLFAIPDFAQAARAQAVDTFLIKTVAILPEPSLRGLGGLLVGLAHQAGYRLGFRRCIHALMHADNISRNISNHFAVPMRHYTLYSREIAP